MANLPMLLTLGNQILLKQEKDEPRSPDGQEILEMLIESNEDDSSGSSSDESLEADEDILITMSQLEVPQMQLTAIHLPIVWHDNKPNVKSIPFTGIPGLKVPNPGQDPINFFFLLATNEFFDLIIRETNKNAINLFMRSQSPRARISKWKDLTRAEFEVFLGLLYLMGNIKIQQTQRYWSKNNLYEFPKFSQNMSRDRFLLILRAMHFNENLKEKEMEPNDPLCKIRSLNDIFVKNMSNIYYPNKELCFEQCIILWRGSLVCNQFIQNKKHKFVIKLYMLTEPNGLVLNTLVYTGLQDPIVGGRGHSEKALITLIPNYINCGHSIYMDNYCNSVMLVQELLQKKILVTGTLRSNRQKNPLVVITKKLKKGESVQMFTDDGICVMKWRDKRDMLFISSEFSQTLLKVANKRGQVIEKPEIIVRYNEFMKGKDRVDQLLSYYSLEMKSLRWYIKLSVHIFHLIMNNSHLLYNRFSGKTINLINFRESVIDTLIYRNRSTVLIAPVSCSVTHLPARAEKKRNKRKRCRVCYSKGIRKDVNIFCPDCPNKPGLCLGQCFKEFHNL